MRLAEPGAARPAAGSPCPEATDCWHITSHYTQPLVPHRPVLPSCPICTPLSVRPAFRLSRGPLHRLRGTARGQRPSPIMIIGVARRRWAPSQPATLPATHHSSIHPCMHPFFASIQAPYHRTASWAECTGIYAAFRRDSDPCIHPFTYCAPNPPHPMPSLPAASKLCLRVQPSNAAQKGGFSFVARVSV